MSITANPAVIIYAIGRIARALGVPKEQAMAVDDALIDRIIHRISDLQSAASDSCQRLLDVTAERDEAQAEVRAMLEGRREEEERARMRMLQALFAADLRAPGLNKTAFLPTVNHLVETRQQVGPEGFRKALLADLDALVALGLRGEVMP